MAVNAKMPCKTIFVGFPFRSSLCTDPSYVEKKKKSQKKKRQSNRYSYMRNIAQEAYRTHTHTHPHENRAKENERIEAKNVREIKRLF